jgi:hypothetical protein
MESLVLHISLELAGTSYGALGVLIGFFFVVGLLEAILAVISSLLHGDNVGVDDLTRVEDRCFVAGRLHLDVFFAGSYDEHTRTMPYLHVWIG